MKEVAICGLRDFQNAIISVGVTTGGGDESEERATKASPMHFCLVEYI
jgi:hypothetical protein